MNSRSLKVLGAALITLSLSHPSVVLSQDITHFRPVEALGVGDITQPAGCYSYGTVVLDVLVLENGEVKNVQVRRAIAGLTETAVRAVRAWSFRPAELDGEAISSRITVAVTFNPQFTTFQQVPLPELIREDDETRIQSAFQPPEVMRAIMPTFPLGATSIGAVVLTVAVDENGKGTESEVLRELAPFTPMAVHAVGDWKFMAATLNGKPLTANVILAFVFPPLQSNP